ncbi:MAG: glycosyltransferase family 2 protein [Polyangia bacterium]
MSQQALGICVLIVNWNASDDLAACLASLAAQSDRDFEVVVVDNGSTDGSCERLRREFPAVRLVETGANLGFAEGVNRGLTVVTAPWVFVLNNDTRCDPGVVGALRAAARAGGPRLGMLQARIVFWDRPHLTNSTGVRVARDGEIIDRDFLAPLRPADGPEEIFCASAGAALYRREMLEAVRLPSGVFDRSFFMYLEDVDLGWRCRLAGWQAEYVPAALVYHRFQGSASRQKRAFVATHCHLNKVRTLLKNGSLRYLAAALPGVLLLDVLPLVRHQGGAALGLLASALRDGLRQRPQVAGLGARDGGAARRDVERRWFGAPTAPLRTRLGALLGLGRSAPAAG